ncbi:MAG: class I SAM-dependent methyltransferase family protein, partial [Thermoplasmata archaeon]|nr:class I SAM-dependent methyltransferase family protein [Thermoplasmata archaeon]
MKIPCLKVSKKEAEKVRRKLIEKNLLLKGYRVERDENFVYFPVKEDVEFENYKIVYREMKKVGKKS